MIDQKLKLYVYPHAQKHVHDTIPAYINTVPMSEVGIEKHFELCGPNAADYFYMGQFGDGHGPELVDLNQWEFFEKYPERHIADIEGDWLGKEVPEHFKRCITTRNGILESDVTPKVCVRPTFSVFLVNAGREPIDEKERFSWPEKHGFSFKGLGDPFGVRHRMIDGFSISGLPGEASLNSEFLAPIPLDDPRRIEYINRMKKYTFALCPRGAGLDSVRYLEACYLGRCPVIVGNHAIVGDNYYDTSFMFRVTDNKSALGMSLDFSKIFHNTSMQEAIDRGKAARDYFDTVIRDYFKDPTKYFINFLKRNDL
jgi:hypothetical protein